MLPGRFPSPTPSREMTPVEMYSPLPEVQDVGSQISEAGAQSRRVSSDFTAANHFRTRPQFTATQSEPTIDLSSSSSPLSSDRFSDLSSPSNVNRPARDRRRVSDPLHSRPRSTVHSDPNSIRKPRQKRQRLSDSAQYNIRTVQPPHYSAASQTPSTPLRHAVPSSASHQANQTPSPSRAPTSTDGYTKAEPDSEHSQSGNQEERRPRSPVAPKTASARSVHDRLRAKLLEDLTFSDTSGVIYILHDPQRPELGYKIGSTTRANYEDRIDEHRRTCKFEPEVVYVSPCETEHCIRTEKLIQLDLENHCRRWQCDKHKASNGHPKISTHEEWFQVTRKLAIRTVLKWETFMRHAKPYDWRRKLKPVWRYLLDKRRLLFPGDAAALTHEARREHWTLVLAPPATADYVETYWRRSKRVLSRLCETISCTWLYAKAFFWQLTTLVYGMMMFSVCRSTVAFAAFAVLLVCASFSVLPHLQLSPHKRRSRRLS